MLFCCSISPFLSRDEPEKGFPTGETRFSGVRKRLCRHPEKPFLWCQKGSSVCQNGLFRARINPFYLIVSRKRLADREIPKPCKTRVFAPGTAPARFHAVLAELTFHRCSSPMFVSTPIPNPFIALLHPLAVVSAWIPWRCVFTLSFARGLFPVMSCRRFRSLLWQNKRNRSVFPAFLLYKYRAIYNML